MEKILNLFREGKTAQAREAMLDANTVDLAEFFDDMENDVEFVLLFRILPKDEAAEVFSYMDVDSQQYLVEKMADGEVANIFSSMYMDDTVDFIEEMPANVVKKVLNNTTKDRRQLINKMLSYPEDSAGSVMTTEFVDIKKELTVSQAIARVRRIGHDKETINILYVINDYRKLEGIVEIRELLLSDDDQILEDLMDKNYISIQTTDDQEEVAALFKKYGYLSMPVVDKENRLVGIITVDDVLDIIEEENEEDFAKMNALAPSEEEYLERGVFDHAKKRIAWLFFLMISATFTGIIIRKYEAVLQSVVLLAAFIPTLMDTGGNAGSQSSTLIIRGLALGELKLNDCLRILWKEFRISLLVGVILAGTNFLRLYVFEKHDIKISMTVCLSMLLTVVIAKVIGGMLPLAAKKLRLDPAIMAGPLITTIVDAIALMVYFGLASMLVL